LGKKGKRGKRGELLLCRAKGTIAAVFQRRVVLIARRGDEKKKKGHPSALKNEPSLSQRRRRQYDIALSKEFKRRGGEKKSPFAGEKLTPGLPRGERRVSRIELTNSGRGRREPA